MRGWASEGSGVVGEDQETILIDAGVAVVAHAGERVQIHRQLERRQLPVAAHLLRRNLVDGGAEMVVRALCVFGETRSEIRRSMCRACPGRIVRA